MTLKGYLKDVWTITTESLLHPLSKSIIDMETVTLLYRENK
jgi:hypothetical protein